jgi:hypothetical protein
VDHDEAVAAAGDRDLVLVEAGGEVLDGRVRRGGVLLQDEPAVGVVRRGDVVAARLVAAADRHDRVLGRHLLVDGDDDPDLG